MKWLEGDPSRGTAVQYISLWLNPKRALPRIREKECVEVAALTLDIPKYGKRFHVITLKRALGYS